jgi:hypothetical protein
MDFQFKRLAALHTTANKVRNLWRDLAETEEVTLLPQLWKGTSAIVCMQHGSHAVHCAKRGGFSSMKKVKNLLMYLNKWEEQFPWHCAQCKL